MLERLRDRHPRLRLAQCRLQVLHDRVRRRRHLVLLPGVLGHLGEDLLLGGAARLPVARRSRGCAPELVGHGCSPSSWERAVAYQLVGMETTTSSHRWPALTSGPRVAPKRATSHRSALIAAMRRVALAKGFPA